MYLNCREHSSQLAMRNPKELAFDGASTLYIGQAGPILKGSFQVNNSLSFPHFTYFICPSFLFFPHVCHIRILALYIFTTLQVKCMEYKLYYVYEFISRQTLSLLTWPLVFTFSSSGWLSLSQLRAKEFVRILWDANSFIEGKCSQSRMERLDDVLWIRM